MDTVKILFGVATALMTTGPALLFWVWARRRTSFWLLLAAAGATAGIGWWIDVYLVLSSAGDLGGMFDCYPYCSASQEAARGVLGYVPTVMAAVLVALLLGSVIRRAWPRLSTSARVRRT